MIGVVELCFGKENVSIIGVAPKINCANSGSDFLDISIRDECWSSLDGRIGTHCYLWGGPKSVGRFGKIEIAWDVWDEQFNGGPLLKFISVGGPGIVPNWGYFPSLTLHNFGIKL